MARIPPIASTHDDSRIRNTSISAQRIYLAWMRRILLRMAWNIAMKYDPQLVRVDRSGLSNTGMDQPGSTSIDVKTPTISLAAQA